MHLNLHIIRSVRCDVSRYYECNSIIYRWWMQFRICMGGQWRRHLIQFHFTVFCLLINIFAFLFYYHWTTKCQRRRAQWPLGMFLFSFLHEFIFVTFNSLFRTHTRKMSGSHMQFLPKRYDAVSMDKSSKLFFSRAFNGFSASAEEVKSTKSMATAAIFNTN